MTFSSVLQGYEGNFWACFGSSHSVVSIQKIFFNFPLQLSSSWGISPGYLFELSTQKVGSTRTTSNAFAAKALVGTYECDQMWNRVWLTSLEICLPSVPVRQVVVQGILWRISLACSDEQEEDAGGWITWWLGALRLADVSCVTVLFFLIKWGWNAGSKLPHVL